MAIFSTDLRLIGSLTAARNPGLHPRASLRQALTGVTRQNSDLPLDQVDEVGN
jgi:hypothetical protein